MTYDVVIVGAGVMGSAAAYWLSRAGKRAALLEKHAPAHVGAASGDHSRTIRVQYRGQAAYTQMAARAVELWKEFDQRHGADVYREHGVLSMQANPGHAPLLDGYEGLRQLGYRPQWLDAADLRRRFPQFANVDAGFLMDGVGGYLAAGAATQALADAARDLGAEVHLGTDVVELRESGGRVAAAVARGGRAFEAETFVIAVGSWTAQLLPDFPLRVQPTAARLHYLRPRDRAAYAFPRFRPFSVMDTQFYGFPVHWRECVKVADDAIGAPFDPDDDREHSDPAALAKLRAFLRAHLPALADAEVVYSKTCTYAMTQDSDFAIGFLPGRANAVAAAGFSGHGFKFGILIGQILADLAMRGASSWDLSRFRLDRTPSPVVEHW